MGIHPDFQLLDRVDLDLTHSLPRNVESPPYVAQRTFHTVLKTKAKPQDSSFPFGQITQLFMQ